MIGAAQRYRELLEDLLLERELAGHALPSDTEAKFAAELDRCWNAMTEQEQEEAEHRFADELIPPAPEELGAEDVLVKPGDQTAPRKAA